MITEGTILGIDPGLADTGWGVLEIQKEKCKMQSYGIVKTKSSEDVALRLEEIYLAIQNLIRKYQPDIVAIEKLFFGKNAKTAMVVGQARGVVVLACQHQKVIIDEYTPLQIKLALCGYGRAGKKQVQQMVQKLLKLDQLPKPDDAADALAVAYTAAVTNQKLT